MTTIRVGCRNTSHEGRWVKVEMFTKADGIWWHKGPVRQEGWGYLHWAGPDPDYTAPDGGTRYRIECKLCGLTLTARYPTLAAALDLIADTGESYVELSTLCGIVGRARHLKPR